MKTNKLLFALMLLASLAVPMSTFAKEGAKIQPVDRNGNPVGKERSLPDCRSCEVRQTGPNSYEIKVPGRVRDQVDNNKLNKK